jgi:hypothetical protein
MTNFVQYYAKCLKNVEFELLYCVCYGFENVLREKNFDAFSSVRMITKTLFFFFFFYC